MAWLVLILSGAMESVWATALGKSDGFSKPIPTAVFAVSLLASMAGLAIALRDLPVGTAYAVWVGIGAVLTVLVATVGGAEPMSWLKALFLVLIVAGVMGLKATH